MTVGITPQRYLFAGRAPGEYCLGVFDNGWQGVLLGGILVRDVLVQVRGPGACVRRRARSRHRQMRMQHSVRL